MGILDWIIVLLVITGVILSIRRMIKKGGGCSCSSCSSCMGTCETCKEKCSSKEN